MTVRNLPAELITCSICDNPVSHDLESNINTEDLLNPRIPYRVKIVNTITTTAHSDIE